MTSAQRLALALAFDALQARITARPAVTPHLVITARHQVFIRTSRRGPYKRREEKYIAE